jgi:peptide/nickel transport system substrate-binding protein
VDDFTVRFSFAAPFPLFILRIAEPILPAPAHYMQQFHPNYVDQADLDKMTADADFENWYELYGDKGNLYDNPELPTWNPWVVTTDAAAQRYLAGRNPYYFKVDPEGNQLPYIDEIAHDLVEETELYLTKAIAGELDMQGRHVGTADNFPILKENEAKGDYRVLEWTPTLGNSYQIMFNQSFDADPVIAKYITDKKFRQALSVAIDREDFIEVVSLGQGTPRQVTVMDISPDFKPEYATRYIDYDTDQANAWLDELGLDQKDAEGFRIAPESGEALTLTISCVPDNAESNELIKEYWAEVGIKTVVKTEERSVHYERMSSNELQLSTWGMDGALYPLWLNYAYWIVPWVQGSSRIGPAYGLWRDTNGEQGKEPTGDMGRALELFDQAVAEVDEEKRIALASQVLDIASEGVWAIGTYLLAKGFFVVKNSFRNVPEAAVSDWILRTPKNTHTEQYFIKS